MALHLRGTGSIQEWQEDSTYNSTTGGGLELSQQQQQQQQQQQRQQQQVERRQDSVEILGDDNCRLATKLETTYGGQQGTRGSMFSILAKNETLEILTFEFDYSESADAAADLQVQVYYRKGGFLDVVSEASEWTQIADTAAIPAPDTIGAIIPTSNVKPVTVDAGELYSFYLVFKTDQTALRVGPSQLEPGAPWKEDDLLEVQVGVSLESRPFFPGDQAATPSTFRGIVHYKTEKKCVDARTTTDVILDFAVATDPAEDVIDQLNQAIEGAVTALLILDPNFIRYKKFHYLEVVHTKSGFQGRSDACIGEFTACSLISTTLTVAHTQSLEPGILQTELLSFESREQIIESVVIQSDVATVYVGEPVTTGEFIFALEGVPDGIPMNALQRRYFEHVTSEFMYSFSKDLPIYRVDVTDQVVSGGDTSSEERRRLTRGLRGTPRLLQAAGAAQVVTTIYGSAASASDLRSAVLETLVLNNERYRLELSREQLRPGEINELDSGDWFGDISKVSASIKPSNFGGGGGGEDSGPTHWFTPLAICIVALSIIWLAYRIYKDYYKVYMTPISDEEMKKLEKEGQDPETGSSESDPMRQAPEPMHPGSNHNRRPSLDGQGLPRGSNHSRGSTGNRRPSWDGQQGHLPPGSNHSGAAAGRRPSWDGHPRPAGSNHSRGAPPPGSNHSRGAPPGSNHSRGAPPGSNHNRPLAGSNHNRPLAGSNHNRPLAGSNHNRLLPGSNHSRPLAGSNHNRPLPGSNHSRLEGPNRRPSLDGKMSNSDHQSRRPTTQPSLDRLQAGHPRNRAGENGRIGLTRSKSADYQPRPQRSTGSIDRPHPNSTQPRMNTSDHSRGLAPRNLAGQNGRGFQGNNSMPMLTRKYDSSSSSSDSESEEESGSSSDEDESTFASSDNDESGSSDEENTFASSGDNEKTTAKNVTGSKRRMPVVQTESTAKTDKKDGGPSSKGNSKKSTKKVTGKTAGIKPKSRPAVTKMDRHDQSLPKLVSHTSESSNDDSSLDSTSGESNEKGGAQKKKVIGKSNDSNEEASIDSDDNSISSEESEAPEPRKVAVVAKKIPTVFKGIPKKKTLNDHDSSSFPKNQAGQKKGIKASQSMPVMKKKSILPQTADNGNIMTFNAPKKVQQQPLDRVPKVQPPKVNGLKSSMKNKIAANPADSEAEDDTMNGSSSLKSKASIASKIPPSNNASEISDSSPIHEKKAINRSGTAGRGISGSMSMPVSKKAPPSKITTEYAEQDDDMSEISSSLNGSLNSTATPNSKSRQVIEAAKSIPMSKKKGKKSITTEELSTSSRDQGTAKSQTTNKTNKVDKLAKYASGHKCSDDEHDRGNAVDDDDDDHDAAANPRTLKPKTEPPKRMPPKISKSMPFQKREPPKPTKSFGGTGKIKFQPNKFANGSSGGSVASAKSKETQITHKSAPEFKPFTRGQIKRSRSADFKPSYVKPITKRPIKFQPKKTDSSSSDISVTSKNTMKSAKTQTSHKSAPEFKPFNRGQLKRTYSAEVKPSHVKPITKREIIGRGNLSRTMSADRKDLIRGRLSSILPAENEDDNDLYIPKIRPKRRTIPIKSTS